METKKKITIEIDVEDFNEVRKELWALYSDLEYWLNDMEQYESRIPKHVLKMALRHMVKVTKNSCDYFIPLIDNKI